MTIAREDITATFAEAQAMPLGDAGRGAGAEDNYDAEGYDETQRAEILEVESVGPNDGAIQTDIRPDLGGGDADDDEIEDEEDRLTALEDTDRTGGTSVLGEDEDSEDLLPDDSAVLAEQDEDDFDVDYESSATPGQIGA